MNTDITVVPSYASVGRRFVAIMIDALILLIPCAVMARLIPVIGGVVILFLYEPVLISSEIRATIGKRLMGIQVTTLTGGRIPLRAALIRQLMKFVSSFIFFIGYIMAFFTERKQTLHDLVAETVVVPGEHSRPVVDAWLANLKSIFGSAQTTATSSVTEDVFAPRGDFGNRDDQISRLERLQNLRDRGALTEEEFQAEKKKILGDR